MDRHSKPQPSAAEVEPWELDHARYVAKRFPDLETDDLAAELAVTILELKRRPLSHVRNWKAYLTKVLFHRAAKLAAKWRKGQTHEIPTDTLPEASRPDARESDSRFTPREIGQWLSKVRPFLDAKSFRLLKQLVKANFNQSLLARLKGVHRNTIRRQLDAIAKALRKCPIRKYSDRPVILAPSQWVELQRIAQSGQRRLARRAAFILSLGSGHSYIDIQVRFQVTARTISHWKRRFVTDGIEGLVSRHDGGKPLSDATARLTAWLKPRCIGAHEERPSCRRLAQRFGTSKSTVQRVLKALRVQA